MSSSDFSYEAGEKVTVLYDPTRPIHSNIDSFATVWMLPLIVIGVQFDDWKFACHLAVRV